MSKEKKTIICRCEEITLEEVETAIDAGCSSVGAVKRYSRAGMGPCQGRGCGSAIAGIIARKTGQDLLSVGEDKPRFPSVPVTIDSLSTLEEFSGDELSVEEYTAITDSPSLDTTPPSLEPRAEKQEEPGVENPGFEDNGSRTERGRVRVKRKAVVIGAGYHGTSAASALAKAGVQTVLLEQREIGTGASGNNFGCIQLQDSNLGLSFQLNSRGFQRMLSMEKELGRDLEFREMGSLLYAQTDEELEELIFLREEIGKEGLQVELLEPKEMLRYEPYMDIRTMRGASYFKQANINPFKYLFALAQGGVEAGLEIREKCKVEEILHNGTQCKGVRLSDGSILEADYIILAAGAWSRKLSAGCGLDVPVEYVIGEAFVSEPIQPALLSFLSSASFFTATHGSSGPSTSFTAGQTAAGNILIGETSEPGPEDPDAAVHLTSGAHCRNMPNQLSELFPALKELSVMRSWTTCSPSTPDFEPFLGPAGPEGLIFATGFKSSVVISPVVGEVVADLVVQGSTFCDLSPYMDRVGPLKP